MHELGQAQDEAADVAWIDFDPDAGSRRQEGAPMRATMKTARRTSGETLRGEGAGACPAEGGVATAVGVARRAMNTAETGEAVVAPGLARRVLMVCTAGRGGMLSVIEAYEADGLFERWGVRLFSPHDEGSLARRLWLAAAEILRFVVEICTHRVTLVHCHAAELGSFWRKSIFGLLARLRGIPVLFHLHGAEMKVFYDGQAAPVRALITWILERYTRVVVLSPSWADWVREVAPKARVFVLHNYVRLPEPARSRDGNGPVRILFLGIIGHRKGVYDLLPAFSRALAAQPGMKLLIGGNGEVDEARARATELGLGDAVEFLGWVGGERKDELLAEADIFVLPSYNEGLPISLLEAMSWGIPVVSTTVGGIPELIRDGTDGVLIEAGDVPALTDALTRLAGNPALRARMGRAGRAQVADAFSREAVLPRLEALYAEVSEDR